MAQRTVMRMNIAQLKAMDGDPRSPTVAGTQLPPPTDIIYFVTKRRVKANGQGHHFGCVFGPSRSLENALKAIFMIYPRARGFLQHNPAKGFAHIRWTDDDGD